MLWFSRNRCIRHDQKQYCLSSLDPANMDIWQIIYAWNVFLLLQKTRRSMRRFLLERWLQVFCIWTSRLILSYLILCTLPFGLLNCFPPIKWGDIQFLQLLSPIHRHLNFYSSAQLGKIRFDIYFTKKKYLFYLNVLDLQGVFYWCPPKS